MGDAIRLSRGHPTLETMMIKLVSKEKGAYWATLDGEKIPRFIIRDVYDAAESGWYYNMSDRTI